MLNLIFINYTCVIFDPLKFCLGEIGRVKWGEGNREQWAMKAPVASLPSTQQLNCFDGRLEAYGTQTRLKKLEADRWLFAILL